MPASMIIEAEPTDRAIQARRSKRQQADTVADLIEELDALAIFQGRPLGQLVQLDADECDEMTEAMEQEGLGWPSHPRPDPASWHQPAEGLATVRALLDHREQHPGLIQQWDDRTSTDIDDLVLELEGFGKVLKWLMSRQLRFRFDWS